MKKERIAPKSLGRYKMEMQVSHCVAYRKRNKAGTWICQKGKNMFYKACHMVKCTIW